MDVTGPQYDLSELRVVARKGNIVLKRRAARDSLNLNYYEDEIIECLCKISPSDYYKSISYRLDNGKDVVFDVYKLECENSQQILNEMYIKVSIVSGNWVTVGSFKLR